MRQGPAGALPPLACGQPPRSICRKMKRRLALCGVGRILRPHRKGAAVQQNDPHITLITPDAPMSAASHGGRAKCLQRLVRLQMPVPLTVALSFDAVHRIAQGEMPDMAAMLAPFGSQPLLCVRPSSQDPDWGGRGRC